MQQRTRLRGFAKAMFQSLGEVPGLFGSIATPITVPANRTCRTRVEDSE